MNKKRTFWYSLLLSLVLLTCWPALAASAMVRSLSISPLAFTRNTTSADLLTDNDIALRWVANSTQEAGFYLSRPPDWDGVTQVKVTITFAQGGSNACSINWRLKLNSYTPNSGQWLTNPGTRNADAILNVAAGPSGYRVYTQTFTIQVADFHNRPFWSFFFLRGNSGNGETYTGYLYVLNVEVSYNATNQAVVIPLN
jgi:hypothetical protein